MICHLFFKKKKCTQAQLEINAGIQQDKKKVWACAINL